MRGIGADYKRNFIRDTIYNRKLDFVGIQETIKPDFTKNELHNLCGGRNFTWVWSQARRRSGGILVGINNDNLDVIHSETGIYFVRTHLYDKQKKFDCNLITVYGDAQTDGKVAYLAELSRVYQDNDAIPCVVGGDFNIIRNSTEKPSPLAMITGVLFSMLSLNMQV